MNTLAYTIAEACTLTRTGKTALYEAIKTGELRAVKRGRRTLVLPADLGEWIEKLPTIQRQRQSARKHGAGVTNGTFVRTRRRASAPAGN